MPTWENSCWNCVLSKTSYDNSGCFYIPELYGKVNSTWLWFWYLFRFSGAHNSPSRVNLVISLIAISAYLCHILLSHWTMTPYFTWSLFFFAHCSETGFISPSLRTKHLPSLGIYCLHWKLFLSLAWDWLCFLAWENGLPCWMKYHHDSSADDYSFFFSVYLCDRREHFSLFPKSGNNAI